MARKYQKYAIRVEYLNGDQENINLMGIRTDNYNKMLSVYHGIKERYADKVKTIDFLKQYEDYNYIELDFSKTDSTFLNTFMNEIKEEEDPVLVRFAFTRLQARALGNRATELLAVSRPTCGNCGRPIEPSGHFCPERNGHGPGKSPSVE